MSDLAPFVAAVLRDGVVKDLMDENERLREEIEERDEGFMFQLTGREGAPIYFEQLITNRHPLDWDEWGLLNMYDINVNLSFETFMKSFEIWLGGELLPSNQVLNAENSENDDVGFYFNFDEGHITAMYGETDMNCDSGGISRYSKKAVIYNIDTVILDESFVEEYIIKHLTG